MPDSLNLWELVSDTGAETTYRMAVPGGWLYRHCYIVEIERQDGQVMVFVPGRREDAD